MDTLGTRTVRLAPDGADETSGEAKGPRRRTGDFRWQV